MVCSVQVRSSKYWFFVTANAVKDIVVSRAAQYQSTASQHRLNQPPTLNAGLQAANAAQVKNKLATLKKQAKADTVTAEATLYYYPKNGAVAKKVSIIFHAISLYLTCFLKAQLLPVLKKYFGSDPAKQVLDTARDDLKKAWLESPASNISGINTMNFDEWDLTFNIFYWTYDLKLSQRRFRDQPICEGCLSFWANGRLCSWECRSHV